MFYGQNSKFLTSEKSVVNKDEGEFIEISEYSVIEVQSPATSNNGEQSVFLVMVSPSVGSDDNLEQNRV